jgi:Putative beta-barrel porin-2, OmpL-like. bbp2
MKKIILLGLFFIPFLMEAQVVNTATIDTLKTTVIGHLGIGVYVDTYYGYSFSKPPEGNVSYFVSSARHNELNINLAYIDVRYRSNRMRARFVPGFGSYMNANYKDEPGTLKNIVEGNVGVALSEKNKIWVDVGVLGSPFTNESAISKNQLMYTRSFAPENVPYYITGAKLSIPLAPKWTSYLYFLNGWQIIQDNNKRKSFALQFEFRPGDKMLFNWNNYFGDERTSTQPDFRKRFFSDLFWIFKPNTKWDIASCVYWGTQLIDQQSPKQWWQANAIASYHFTNAISLSGRVEYFHDPGTVMITSLSAISPFRSYSSSVCINWQTTDQSLFRVEVRKFYSKDEIFGESNRLTNNDTWLVASLTAWF